MSILVMGSNGYLAETVVPYLKEIDNVLEFDLPNSIYIVDKDFIIDNNINVILNLTNVGIKENITHEAWNTNIKLPFYIANLLKDLNKKIKFIHVSSRESFGSTFSQKQIDLSDPKNFLPLDSFSEKVDNNPKNEFGWSKLIAENIVSTYGNSIILRLSTPYTNFLYENRGGLISRVGYKALVCGEVDLANGGSQYRDPLHALDFANFCSIVLKSKFVPGIFHLGGGEQNYLSLSQIVKTINPECKINSISGGDFGIVLNISKAIDIYNWKPIINIADNKSNFTLIQTVC